jgi:hypothetical protein
MNPQGGICATLCDNLQEAALEVSSGCRSNCAKVSKHLLFTINKSLEPWIEAFRFQDILYLDLS